MLYFILCLLLLGFSQSALAARTVLSEGVIHIKLELGQPTAMVFPEAVSTVTTAMPESRLMINKDHVYIGFVAVDPSMPPNRQAVVGESGRVYLVMVEVVPDGKRGDDLVYVTHKAPPQAELLTPVSVLRALRSPKGPGPAQPLTVPLPTTSDTRVTLSEPRQYTMGPYQALVLTLTNTQETLVPLDERVGLVSAEIPDAVRLHEWVWPPMRKLKAVAVEQPFLLPRGSTTLYLVFQER